ncbi:hypothetical protein IFR05_007671 [Cadophora sp. M221]|nr:hypothetical protein IFR05_007671 [Cadophora sp. M221]
MAPHSSQEPSRSSSSKKDSKDKDKSSCHHTIGESSSRRPIPEEDEYADSSSRKEKSVLHSAFFNDQSRAPSSSSHHTKDSKTSKYESHSKRSPTSRTHGEPSKSTHQDQHTKPPMKYEDRPEKTSKQDKPRPSHLFKTTFTDLKDIEMAERQTRLKTLKPEEVVKQHKWAQEKLNVHDEAGNKLEGYRCFAGNHLVTHELLAEAKGGFYCKHRPILKEELEAAQAAQGRFGFSGSNMIPPYTGGYGGMMMPGFAGGTGFSVQQNRQAMIQQAQAARQIQQIRRPQKPAPRGFSMWYGPEYPIPNFKELRADMLAWTAKHNPQWMPPVGNVPDEHQQGKPDWLLRGD